MKKHYLYAQVPESIKKKAVRLAKKEDLSLSQWLRKIIRGMK